MTHEQGSATSAEIIVDERGQRSATVYRSSNCVGVLASKQQAHWKIWWHDFYCQKLLSCSDLRITISVNRTFPAQRIYSRSTYRTTVLLQ